MSFSSLQPEERPSCFAGRCLWACNAGAAPSAARARTPVLAAEPRKIWRQQAPTQTFSLRLRAISSRVAPRCQSTRPRAIRLGG